MLPVRMTSVGGARENFPDQRKAGLGQGLSVQHRRVCMCVSAREIRATLGQQAAGAAGGDTGRGRGKSLGSWENHLSVCI